MPSLRIAIVGGSIAGVAAGIELGRSGHEVVIFERSSGELRSRGAGMVVPVALVAMLKDSGLVGSELPGVVPRVRRWSVRDGDAEFGRVLGEQMMQAEYHSYGQIIGSLMASATDVEYRGGAEVVDVTVDGVVKGKSGGSERFDLVVGADGYGSRVRKSIFPDSRPTYAGYPAWRGLLEEAELDDVALLEEVCETPGIPRGHANFYLVPGREDEMEKGRRQVNWLIYDGNTPDHLVPRGAMSSVAPGHMDEEQVNYLHRLARSTLPPWHAQVIKATKRPYMQPIYDLPMNSYVRGRVCLIGDAATVTRPHTGSGATKALYDAVALGDAIEGSASVVDALARFDEERSAAGNELVKLGRDLGHDQVTSAPPWDRLDSETFVEWARSTATGNAYYVAAGEP